VGHRTCTLTVPRPTKGKVACAVCEWSPDVPSNLTADEWSQYRAGRDQAAAELAAQLGGAAAVIEP
jgi:hypothetical protein